MSYQCHPPPCQQRKPWRLKVPGRNFGHTVICAVALLCCGWRNEYFCQLFFITHAVICVYRLCGFCSLDSILLLETVSKNFLRVWKKINYSLSSIVCFQAMTPFLLLKTLFGFDLSQLFPWPWAWRAARGWDSGFFTENLIQIYWRG